jgi:hypothetical protein
MYEIQTTGLLETETRALWNRVFTRHHLEQIPVPPMKVVRMDLQTAAQGVVRHPIERKLRPNEIFDALESNNPNAFLDVQICTVKLWEWHTAWDVHICLGVCEHGHIFVYRSDR